MLRMVLSKLPGVGERLAQKITEHFGGEEEAIASLKSGDIACCKTLSPSHRVRPPVKECNS